MWKKIVFITGCFGLCGLSAYASDNTTLANETAANATTPFANATNSTGVNATVSSTRPPTTVASTTTTLPPTMRLDSVSTGDERIAYFKNPDTGHIYVLWAKNVRNAVAYASAIGDALGQSDSPIGLSSFKTSWGSFNVLAHSVLHSDNSFGTGRPAMLELATAPGANGAEDAFAARIEDAFNHVVTEHPIHASEEAETVAPYIGASLVAGPAIATLFFGALLLKKTWSLGGSLAHGLSAEIARGTFFRQHAAPPSVALSQVPAYVPPPSLPAPAPASAPKSGSGGLNGKCVVCQEKRASHAPQCGHQCACRKCYTPLTNCPMCRAPVEKWLKIINT